MSQMVTRKGGVGDEKEKRTDSPVKDMKKKMAANAEKEKLAAEKPKETEKTDKPAEKKPEKNGVDKSEKKEQKSDKKEPEKKEAEKKEQDKKEDKEKNAKANEPKPSKPKQNGAKSNGVDSNGDASPTVSEDETERDELFPELAYDETSDPEPDVGARSFTRRDQVLPARTPETPRPDERAPDNKDTKPKDGKKDEGPDRKLRSADPKPETKKPEKEKEKEPKKQEKDAKKDASKKENGDNEKEVEVVVVEIEDDEPRKTDTNYSKSRVKVSPYRRSVRLADQTNTSVMADYTGNNTTMEMDITESSIITEQSFDDSYLSGLRTIRGRRSYKPLGEITVRSVPRPANVSEPGSRPTAPVVGRKRKPDADPEDSIELARDALDTSPALHKRSRLLERIAAPLRRTLAAASTPLPIRRNAEIVGINTDLPLTAPVATEPLDPESLKAAPAAPAATPAGDNKRCVVM